MRILNKYKPSIFDFIALALLLITIIVFNPPYELKDYIIVVPTNKILLFTLSSIVMALFFWTCWAIVWSLAVGLEWIWKKIRLYNRYRKNQKTVKAMSDCLDDAYPWRIEMRKKKVGKHDS